jgi:clan AA aspartic protease (TIGR02281 family)
MYLKRLIQIVFLSGLLAASEHAIGDGRRVSSDEPAPSSSTASVAPADSFVQGGGSVQLKEQGGTFVVPVQINNALTLDFTVDSGAADVAVPADVILTLIRTGTIADSDFLGSQTYTLANGDTVPSQTLVLHSLTVGSVTVRNVQASVSSVNGSLLLGQSFFSHLSSWSIDNAHQQLVLGAAKDGGAVSAPPPKTAAAPAPISISPPPVAADTGNGPKLAIYGGLDFYGNDIFKGRVSDSVACATSCIGNRMCRAFTFNANPSIHTGPNCFLKADVGRVEAYSTAFSGKIVGPNEPEPTFYAFAAIDPTIDLLANRDLPGNDLSAYPYAPAKTLDNCRMACIDNSDCRAFSFAANVKQCWLKGQVGQSRSLKGVTSGIKHYVSISPAKIIDLSR